MPSNQQTQSQSDQAKRNQTEINPQPGSPAKNFPPPRPLSGESRPTTSQAQRPGQNVTQNQQKRDQANQRNPEHPDKPAPEDEEIDVDDEITTPQPRTTKDESI